MSPENSLLFLCITVQQQTIFVLAVNLEDFVHQKGNKNHHFPNARLYVNFPLLSNRHVAEICWKFSISFFLLTSLDIIKSIGSLSLATLGWLENVTLMMRHISFMVCLITDFFRIENLDSEYLI